MFSTSLALRGLVAGVVAVGLVATGYWLGSGVAAGHYEGLLHDQAVAYANGWVAAAAEAETRASAETERRAALALRQAKAGAHAREVKLRGQIDALHTARDACGWPAGRVRLLNDAVDAANATDTDGALAPALGVRGTVPAAAAPR